MSDQEGQDSEEIWRESLEFPGYFGSTKGRVKNSRGHIMSIKTTAKGYQEISLSKDKKSHTVRLNRFLAFIFIPNPNNLPDVDHFDQNRVNNHVSNLRWITKSDNAKNRGKFTQRSDYTTESLEGEEWVLIQGDYMYPYKVSNFGRVWLSDDRKTFGTREDYHTVNLQQKDGRHVKKFVRILVAEAFLPKPESDEPLFVGKKDNNRYNCAVSNLAWMTHEQIVQQSIESGARKTKAVLQFSLDGKLIQRHSGVSAAAKVLNLNPAGISNVLSGKHKSAFGFQWFFEEEWKKNPTVQSIPGHAPRPVVQIDTSNGNIIRSFKSTTEAQNVTGICRKSIVKVASGKRKEAGGFFWKFQDGPKLC